MPDDRLVHSIPSARRSAGLLVLWSLLLAPTAWAQTASEPESLGEVRFTVPCGDDVQPRFDEAVALLHHMTYAPAREAFSTIAREHPECAMAHWGVAMTYFQPLWPTRPSEEDLRLGGEAILRAAESPGASERDRMLIAATGAFFDPSLTEYWQRIEAWAAGMSAALDAFPDDTETRAFFALSHLATAPSSGDLSHHRRAASILGAILGVQPAHPGALHYLIHASDAPGLEGGTPDAVGRYEAVAPANAHALHMPTHIYVRLGDWEAVIAGNRRAAEAALGSPAGDRGQWVWDEYPHAVEYLVYGLLQVGDDAGALAEMTALLGTRNLQPSFKTAFHLSSIPARYALERRDWAGAAALEPKADTTLAWERFPWPEAVTWFARGIGAARTGAAAEAEAAELRLGQLRDASTRSGEELFALHTEILRLGVAGWLEMLEGDSDTAVRLLREAADLEHTTPKHPVTPAPTIPAAELLGDLLLELDQPADALEAYRSALSAAPGRLNSLGGAARSARLMGDSELAATYYAELLKRVRADSPRPERAEAVRQARPGQERGCLD